MNNINLSDRLLEVASFLPKGANFADIGSDHAYLPCYICTHDSSAHAIAGEVNVGPYQSAKTTVQSHQLMGQVEVRLGDGLEVVKEAEVEQVVIAGMGGALITSILANGKSKLSNVERIIAQPNVDARGVRSWFLHNDFKLVDEVIVQENGHTYEILVADKNSEINLYDDVERDKALLFGPKLLKTKPEVFKNKWKSEHDKLLNVIYQIKNAKAPDFSKIAQFEKELEWMREVVLDEK